MPPEPTPVPNPNPAPAPTPVPNPAPPAPDLVAENARLKEELDKLKKTNAPPVDLNTIANLNRTEDEKKKLEQKALEQAVEFNYGTKDFMKNHEGIVPKEVADLFTAAAKENYDSPVQKASAIKTGIIQEFFKVQENLDLLTPAHKDAIDRFGKLTKTGKESEAQAVWENIFEPAVNIKVRMKKADEVIRARNGLATASEVDEAYKKRLIEGSKKSYGVKN